MGEIGIRVCGWVSSRGGGSVRCFRELLVVDAQSEVKPLSPPNSRNIWLDLKNSYIEYIAHA